MFQFLRGRHLRKAGFVDTKDSGTKHGTCKEIPASHQGKPIVACVRNPYDRYVSQFNFRWWARHPFYDVEAVRRKFSNYPDLTFAEFLEFTRDQIPIQNTNFSADRVLGAHTWHFVNFFFRDPSGSFQKIDDAYLKNHAWKQDMFPVHFLKTDQLNQGLFEFLIKVGYDRTEVEFIRGEQKIFPQNKDRRQGRAWEDYYTPELKQLVRTRDRMLFEMFPEFDV